MADYSVYAFRLDGTDPAALKELMSKDGGAYMIVREDSGGNPHYHGILHSKKKIAAVRAALKRAMPELNGNGTYSLSMVRDLEKYVRYMLKGSSKELAPDVVAKSGLHYTSQDFIDEQHDAYWAEAEEIARKRSEPQKNMVDFVFEMCRERHVPWGDRAKIAEIYITELVRRNKPINQYAVRYACNLVQCKLCPDDSAIRDLAAWCGASGL